MRNSLLMTALLSISLLGAGNSARAEQPEAVWTPSAEAPEGLLTQLEAQRHDFFIELAQSGSSCSGAPLRENCAPGEVDVVFFGTTYTEMWWWPDRGMPVWEEAFGSRKAVNFGSQGTRPHSLLWRMRNGELDGYRAKLVVLQSIESSSGLAPTEYAAAYAPLIAEIRARQPQASILIFRLPRTEQQVAEANADPATAIVDNRTVFYAALGEPHIPDTGGYQTWAKELEHWLERFAD